MNFQDRISTNPGRVTLKNIFTFFAFIISFFSLYYNMLNISYRKTFEESRRIFLKRCIITPFHKKVHKKFAKKN